MPTKPTSKSTSGSNQDRRPGSLKETNLDSSGGRIGPLPLLNRRSLEGHDSCDVIAVRTARCPIVRGFDPLALNMWVSMVDVPCSRRRVDIAVPRFGASKWVRLLPRVGDHRRCDIHPSHYGQSIQARVDRIDEGRTGLN